jgi:hypothetical protein
MRVSLARAQSVTRWVLPSRNKSSKIIGADDSRADISVGEDVKLAVRTEVHVMKSTRDWREG